MVCIGLKDFLTEKLAAANSKTSVFPILNELIPFDTLTEGNNTKVNSPLAASETCVLMLSGPLVVRPSTNYSGEHKRSDNIVLSQLAAW